MLVSREFAHRRRATGPRLISGWRAEGELGSSRTRRLGGETASASPTTSGVRLPRRRHGVTRPPVRPCSRECSHQAAIAHVRRRPRPFARSVDLRRRIPANAHGRVAETWGSRGRRFKSCQPDSITAGQGPFPSRGAAHFLGRGACPGSLTLVWTPVDGRCGPGSPAGEWRTALVQVTGPQLVGDLVETSRG